jgi:acetyl esterase/lipase
MRTSLQARRASRGARPAVVVAALALLGTATAGAPPALGDAARPAQPAPTGVRYIDDVFDEVSRTEDVPYREAVNVDGELQALRLDIYEPAGDSAELRPVVLLMHGGSFSLGNHKDDIWGAGPSFAEPFARKGFVAVSMQYRLRPDMGFFPDVDPLELQLANIDAYDDSIAAIGWLRDHADELRIDPRAIVANGPSAGGAMAWNLAWMQGSAPRPEPSGVAAAVSVSGAPFPSTVDTGEPLAAASPGDVPVIAFHGTADPVIGFELAAVPCAAAAEVGVRCDLVPYEGIGHPGLDPAYLPLFDDIGRRTFEFIADVVLVPLGYVDQPVPPVPAPGEPDPPVLDLSPPVSSPSPQARPAVPVPGDPSYTG